MPRLDSCSGEQLRSEADRSSHQASEGRAPASGGSAGEGLLGCPMDRMERTAPGVESGTSGYQGGGEGTGFRDGDGSRNGAAHVALSDPRVFTPALPAAQLRNPHNICYLNSVAQAMSWLGKLANAMTHCGGKASPALNIVLRSGKPYLPECLSWRDILRTWHSLDSQHDASVFLAHLLEYADPTAFRGEWQARLIYPDMFVDSGPLRVPILLEAQGPSLQDSIDHWHRQHTVHALWQHCGAVVLQLKRYHNNAGMPQKDAGLVAVKPGGTVRLPVFCSECGLEVETVAFTFVFAVFHLGDSVDTGHYQAALSATSSCNQPVVPGAGRPGSLPTRSAC